MPKLANATDVKTLPTGAAIFKTEPSAAVAQTVPVPPAPRPMDELLFVHEKEVPLTVPLNDNEAWVPLLQSTWFDGIVTVGIGFTATDTLPIVAEQLLVVFVAIIVYVPAVVWSPKLIEPLPVPPTGLPIAVDPRYS